jgi:hypothetical protein
MVDPQLAGSSTVGPIWGFLELLFNKRSHLLTRQMAAQDVVLAGEGALFLFAKSGNYTRWRSAILPQFPPSTIAVVAVQNVAVLVNINRNLNVARGNVRLQHLEFFGTHVRHNLVIKWTHQFSRVVWLASILLPGTTIIRGTGAGSISTSIFSFVQPLAARSVSTKSAKRPR